MLSWVPLALLVNVAFAANAANSAASSSSSSASSSSSNYFFGPTKTRYFESSAGSLPVLGGLASSLPANKWIQTSGSAVDAALAGTQLTGSQVVSDGAASISGGQVIQGGLSGGQIVTSGAEISGAQVVSSGVLGADGPATTQTFVSRAPTTGYVKNIYGTRTYVEPGKEIIYKVRSKPKVHKQVALVAQVIPPKVEVTRVVSPPKIEHVTLVKEQSPQILKIQPKVHKETIVLQAPKPKPAYFTSEKRRTTLAKKVEEEQHKITAHIPESTGSGYVLAGEYRSPVSQVLPSGQYPETVSGGADYLPSFPAGDVDVSSSFPSSGFPTGSLTSTGYQTVSTGSLPSAGFHTVSTGSLPSGYQTVSTGSLPASVSQTFQSGSSSIDLGSLTGTGGQTTVLSNGAQVPASLASILSGGGQTTVVSGGAQLPASLSSYLSGSGQTTVVSGGSSNIHNAAADATFSGSAADAAAALAGATNTGSQTTLVSGGNSGYETKSGSETSAKWTFGGSSSGSRHGTKF